MLEIRGREIRTSNVNGEAVFKSGEMFLMTAKDPNELSDSKTIHINNDSVLRYLKLNDVVYIDDGKVVGIVKNIGDNGVEMEVKIAGKMKSNSSVRFVNGKHVNLPIYKKSDLEDLAKIS